MQNKSGVFKHEHPRTALFHYTYTKIISILKFLFELYYLRMKFSALNESFQKKHYL